jgi:hypothetical protein
MGGGLMQLVAYGAQDVYLTGDPQITFFKVVYRRHTNFSVESIEQTLNGTVGYGNTVTAVISRNGDLVNNLLIEATVTGGSGAERTRMGYALIAECEIEIGGQRIDKQYSQWMNVWADLTMSNEKKSTLTKMVDFGSTSDASDILYIPLSFWFCRDNGLALPLIALQYHEVKLRVTFETAANMTDASSTPTTPSALTAKLYADYVYLDTDERRKFAQTEHEYLIEQVQRSKETTVSGTNKFRLNFNHPVKELIWCAPSAAFGSYESQTTTARLVLNGHERMTTRNGDYFNWVQPFQHHSGNPSTGVYCYSFALNPEKHQPSGTCNFSRIDNATLEVSSSGAEETHIFAHNYNVLRIMSGMGGLAYSN